MVLQGLRVAEEIARATFSAWGRAAFDHRKSRQDIEGVYGEGYDRTAGKFARGELAVRFIAPNSP
ncbi:MAG: hypothetical protein D6741_15710 [Planctomycetota bacterium]|nr:MAG: hypothetical protein D6741_15710 [Planctomycetota bacterium]